MTETFPTDLDALGLTTETYRAVLLLPLIEVAWADGAIQAEERDAILCYADGNQLLAGEARAVVEDWLTDRPSPDYFDRGRAALVSLAHDDSVFGKTVTASDVGDIVEFCDIIAASAGGLFGRFFKTSPDEQMAINQIAAHIAQLHSQHGD